MSQAQNAAAIHQEKLQNAEAALQKANEMIQEEARIPPGKKAATKVVRERTRKILAFTTQVAAVLEGAAELTPQTKAAVSLFKAVVKLEVDRRENSSQIVAICHAMATAMFVLKYLDQRVLQRDEDLAEQLEDQLGQLSEIMNNFGDFADMYYNKWKQPIFRFLRSGDFRAKLSGFATEFYQARDAMQFLIISQMWGRNVQTDNSVHQILQNTEAVIARLGAPTTPKERQAQQIVQQCGGNGYAIENPQALAKIAKTLEDRLTETVETALHEDFDELMDQNLSQYSLKIDGAKMEINEAIDRSKNAILQRLDSGPHDLIEDPDIKSIWKTNAWKLSVKCRPFVDAVCNYYDDKFRRTAQEQSTAPGSDLWTISVLSKVIYHPSIGDSIDEDGSGFISVHEMNHFLKKRPAHWSVPQWFAFSAVGWQANNITYTSEVSSLLDKITTACNKIVQAKEKAKQEQSKAIISEYLVTIKLLQHVVEWADYLSNDDTGLADLNTEAETVLQTLSTQLKETQDNHIKEKLGNVNFIVTDPALLPVLVGEPGLRIEQWMTCFLSLILSYHSEDIKQHGNQLSDQGWLDMDSTLSLLVFTYHRRMKSLIRGWRSQRMDIDLQMQSFAGGVYEGWYEAYNVTGSDIKKLLDNEDDDEEDDDEEDDSDGNADNQSPAAPAPESKEDILARRVDSIDKRLDQIESMLKTLLGAANQGGPVKPQQPQTRGLQDDSDAVAPTRSTRGMNPQQTYNGYGSRSAARGDDDDDDDNRVTNPQQGYSGYGSRSANRGDDDDDQNRDADNNGQEDEPQERDEDAGDGDEDAGNEYQSNRYNQQYGGYNDDDE